MAPMAWQLTRRQDSGTKSARQSPPTSSGPCARKDSRHFLTFALTADVKEAHRQIPIDPQEWHLLGCQLERGADVFINTVGSFGFSSASYYWSRVASATGRLTQYLAAGRAETWHMVVPDDYHLEAGGMHYRLALVMFFILCSTVGAPLSWHKTIGGDTVVWVGFELLHRNRHLGISQRRAGRFTKWARETADSKYIHLARSEEGLGRIMFVAGALELEQPFLGPLYKFMALHTRQSTRRVPAYVSSILRRTSRSYEALQLCGDFRKRTGGTKSWCTGQQRRGQESEAGSQTC